MADKKKKYLLLDCKIDAVKPIEIINFDANRASPILVPAKIYVCYPGKNRNFSNISRQTIMENLSTIYNIAVVGEWDDEIKNYRGHGGVYELSDESIKFRKTTEAVGVVPESAELKWETVEESDGSVREYLTTTCYLWRDDGCEEKVDKILTDGCWHSMEICVEEYARDDDGCIDITKFSFSALCVLGKSDDPDENVEPCFESARIVALKEDFDLVSDKVEMMLGKIKEFELSFANHIKEDDLMLNKSEFALTNSQLVEALSDELGREKFEDRWGYVNSKYYYLDHIDSTVYAYDRSDGWKIYGFSFSVSGDAVKVDFSTKKRKLVSYVDYVEGSAEPEGSFSFEGHIEAVVSSVAASEKEKYEKLELDYEQSQEDLRKVNEEREALAADFEKLGEEVKTVKSDYDALTEKHTALNSEVGELNSLRKQDLFAKYEKSIGGEADFEDAKANAEKLTYTELEAKCALCYANKTLNVGEFSLGEKREKTEPKGLVVDAPKEDFSLEDAPYGGILRKNN